MLWTVVQLIGVYGSILQALVAALPAEIFWKLSGWLLIPDPAIRNR
jgi:hypothetical protein